MYNFIVELDVENNQLKLWDYDNRKLISRINVEGCEKCGFWEYLNRVDENIFAASCYTCPVYNFYKIENGEIKFLNQKEFSDDVQWLGDGGLACSATVINNKITLHHYDKTRAHTYREINVPFKANYHQCTILNSELISIHFDDESIDFVIINTKSEIIKKFNSESIFFDIYSLSTCYFCTFNKNREYIKCNIYKAEGDKITLYQKLEISCDDDLDTMMEMDYDNSLYCYTDNEIVNSLRADVINGNLNFRFSLERLPHNLVIEELTGGNTDDCNIILFSPSLNSCQAKLYYDYLISVMYNINIPSVLTDIMFKYWFNSLSPYK